MHRLVNMIIAVGLGLIIPSAGMAQVTVDTRLAPDQPPLVEATLGAEGSYLEEGLPELSLAALGHAIEAGADMVGLPVHLTRDGRYVVMYGFTLNATTNVEEVFPDGPSSQSGPATGARKDAIADYTLAEIKQLRLTDGRDGGEHLVPTLAEAIALIDDRILATVVLKAYDRDRLAALFAEYGMENLIVDSGVDERWVQDIFETTGVKVSIRVAYVSNPVAYLDRMSTTYGPALAIISTRFLDKITPELVAKADALGVRIGTWQGLADSFLTQGDNSRWEEALRSGATVFTTAHPTAILDMLGR